MAFIDTVSPDHASGEVQDLYRAQQGGLAYLPNYARVFSHRPAVMTAWAALQRELRRHLDQRAYSLISLAAALATGSSYCALAHGHKLMKCGIASGELAALVRRDTADPLTAGERCMFEVAYKVALDASSVEQRDIDALIEAGFSDAQVFDIVAAAAARCFFARVPDALGVQPDALLGELDETLRGLLVVGRPVSAAAPTDGNHPAEISHDSPVGQPARRVSAMSAVVLGEGS